MTTLEMTKHATPETDAANKGNGPWVPVGHARRLEREKAALRDELERVVSTLERNGWACARSRATLEATKPNV